MSQLPFIPRLVNSILKRVCGDYQVLLRPRHGGGTPFKRKFNEVSTSLADGRFDFKWQDRFPCLDDATDTTSFEPQYLYHTAWAARILAKTKPFKHVDIGSCLRFVSIASAICPLDFYDYRPAEITLSGLTCKEGNLLSLDFADNSIESLSCMHVVEHVGLERYGDPFDPQGDLKAISELQRVTKLGGDLLFVVPMGGRAMIQYNAHRIYTYQQIVFYFNQCDLIDFSLITDGGEFVESAAPDLAAKQRHGCGCFWFKKK